MWSVLPKWMHADYENLILWYLLIWRFDLGIEHIVMIVRISRLFLWYVMNNLMHVMQLWFLGIWKSHFSHLPKLNYACKIECLHINSITTIIILARDYELHTSFNNCWMIVDYLNALKMFGNIYGKFCFNYLSTGSLFELWSEETKIVFW